MSQNSHSQIGRQPEEILEACRTRVIEAVAQNMDLYGVTPSIGRLYGTMYFNEHLMTLDEMQEELGMSKTSMSTGIRTLLELKMVNKVWRKGIRKDLYEVESDWYQTFIDFFCLKWRKGIEINMQAIKKSVGELQALAKSSDIDAELQLKIASDLQKLHHALNYYNWLNRLVDSFETEEIFNFLPKTEEIVESRPNSSS